MGHRTLEVDVGYESASARGWEAWRRGDNAGAAREFTEALRLVGSSTELSGEDQAKRQDEAVVNASIAYIQASEPERIDEPALRELLMRTRDEQSRRGAAQCLASLLAHRDPKRALAYARKALDSARTSRFRLAEYSCIELLGSLYLDQSRLPQALEQYEAAQLMLAGGPRTGFDYPETWPIEVLDRIAYIHVLEDRLELGQEMLEQALESVLKIDAPALLSECLSDLSFVHLRADSLFTARCYGEWALDLAEQHEVPRIHRNCHYLLGEIASLDGDSETAAHHYEALSAYYPGMEGLTDFLQAVDLSSIVNLKEFMA